MLYRLYFWIMLPCLWMIPLAATAQQNSSLTVQLSQNQIYLQTRFIGERLFLFGAIDSDLQVIGERLDVTIILKGPPRLYTLRQKQKRNGIWVNAQQSQQYEMPSFYDIASSRPIAELADDSIRQTYGLGINALGKPRSDAYQSLRDYHKRAGLYRARPHSVTIVRNALFVANVLLPHNAPTGSYEAIFYLLHNGSVLAEQRQTLQVVPAGLGQQLRQLAKTQPFFYGFLAVALATLLGALTALAFRRRSS